MAIDIQGDAHCEQGELDDYWDELQLTDRKRHQPPREQLGRRAAVTLEHFNARRPELLSLQPQRRT